MDTNEGSRRKFHVTNIVLVLQYDVIFDSMLITNKLIVYILHISEFEVYIK